MIKDSGNRTKFESGAVRDIQEGKGRCDLLPLDIIDLWCDDGMNCTLYHVGEYLKHKGSGGPESYFGLALDHFAAEHQVKDLESGEKSKHNTMIPLTQYKWELVLEVAKHFEEGAKKYGDRNWEKGIPCDRYIDSAVRHYCKWRAGWTDEPHDRAFIWNIVCCEWTRQKYGWNLERLGEKSKLDPHKVYVMSTPLVHYKWQDTPGCDFRTKCLNRPYFRSCNYNASGKFVDIAKLSPEELRKRCHNVLGMKDSLLDIPWTIPESPLALRFKKEDIKNEDILRQINELEATKEKEESESKKFVKIGDSFVYGVKAGLGEFVKVEDLNKVHLTETELVDAETRQGYGDDVRLDDDTEITMSVDKPVDFNGLCKILGIDENANIKKVLETMKKSLNCRKMRREHFRKCLDTSCSECEYNTEPFVDSDALQTLIDYVEKTLKDQEMRNRCVKDTDEGWHFYDIDGRLLAYIFNFKESEEGKRRQISRMLHKVWREVTSNPYTIKRIIEERGYICGKDFSIEIAPDIVAKEYELRNRKYNEEE